MGAWPICRKAKKVLKVDNSNLLASEGELRLALGRSIQKGGECRNGIPAAATEGAKAQETLRYLYSLL